MSVIACRICLAYDVRMYSLLNSPLKQIYERLSNVPFHTEDVRPTTVCYICHHQLKKCHKLMLKSTRSDEIFSLILSSGVGVSGSTLDMVRKQSRDLSWCYRITPIEYILSPDAAVRVEVVKVEPKHETEVRDEAAVVKMEEDTFGQPEHGEEETEVGDEAAVVKMEEDTFGQPEHVEEDEEEANTAPLLDLPDHYSSDSKDDIPLADIGTRRDVGIGNKICAKVKNNGEIATYKPQKASANGNDTNITLEEPQNVPFVEEKADEEDNNIVKINMKAMQRNIDTKAQKEHVLVQKNKLYECEICKKMFTRNGHLNQHYRIHTNEKPYGCEICKKRFTGNGNLKKHYRIHTKEKPYECEICKIRFTQNGDLKIHYRIHTKEKPYECEICKKRFTRNDHLKKHYRIHTKEKPYECEICKKRFTRNEDFKKHYRIHTKEKPYECEICKKRFTVYSHLKIHYCIHTKEKPYECEICKKRFTRNSNLKEHYRIHTKEKPYECEICKKRFTQNYGLKYHYRLHTKEKRRSMSPRSCALSNDHKS